MSEIFALLIGAMLTFAAQQFSSWRQHKRELVKWQREKEQDEHTRHTERSNAHETWLLQKRYETALAYLELVDAVKFRHHLKRPQSQDDESMMQMQAIATRAGFVGSEDMRDSTMGLRDAIADLLLNKPGTLAAFDAARSQYIRDARAVLIIDSNDNR